MTNLSIEESYFARKRFIPERMEAFGFTRDGDVLRYETTIMNGDFGVVLTVGPGEKVAGVVTDNMNGEEYAPLRARGYTGSYVGAVREAYSELLGRIADACCEEVLFSSNQANRITRLIYEEYGVNPDFPFSDEKYGSSGVFRHKDSGKWFGLIMNISYSVLPGCLLSGRCDAINLKTDPEAGPSLFESGAVYPAYHMNHRQWITATLDDRLGDDEVMGLISASFDLTRKAKAGRTKNKQRRDKS